MGKKKPDLSITCSPDHIVQNLLLLPHRALWPGSVLPHRHPLIIIIIIIIVIINNNNIINNISILI